MNTVPPINVLHIASSDLWAGAEVQLFTLTRTLHCTLGVSVGVVLLNHGKLEDKLREAGIKVIILNESKLNSLQILCKLIRIIRDQPAAIIHTHRKKENILGSIAALFAGRHPSLRTAHGATELHPSWKQIAKRIILYLDWFCGLLIQQKIIAVSENLGEILNKNFPSNHIRVIENVIYVENNLSHTEKISKYHKTDQTNFKIALAGRLVSVKRADIFIASARYLMDHHPDIKVSFHIFGDGPLRDDLIKLSKELGTDNIVHFEGHCDDMVQALLEIDVLLLTSDHEGLPMILLEAMALQIPIIAHAVGGIPNLLAHGSCGILVREHSASGYGEEISRLLRNPNSRNSIRKKAFSIVKTRYSAETNARTYLAEYTSIVENKNNS